MSSFCMAKSCSRMNRGHSGGGKGALPHGACPCGTCPHGASPRPVDDSGISSMDSVKEPPQNAGFVNQDQLDQFSAKREHKQHTEAYNTI
jgi:hypothetical protein